MDRAQNVDEKNGDIGLVSMFTPSVMVTKMSKMDSFFCFLQQQKISHSLGKIFKCT